MTEATARIRWQDRDIHGHAGFVGYVGTLRRIMFQVWRDHFGEAEWTLGCGLPGQLDRRLEGDDPEALKKAAEEWLAGFVSSLGAVFPDAALALADRWQQFAADGDAQDECARELRETIAGPGSIEDVVAASIEQQSAYRNELRHLPGYMSSQDVPGTSAPRAGERE